MQETNIYGFSCFVLLLLRAIWPLNSCMRWRDIGILTYQFFKVQLFRGMSRYQNLKPYGFTCFGHPKLAAKGSGQPSILLWGKKDPHSDGIADVDLSYDQADEVQDETISYGRDACRGRENMYGILCRSAWWQLCGLDGLQK